MLRSERLTLASAWWPRADLASDILRVVLGSLLVAVCAQISLPLQPVPITGQTLGVLLVGALLGSRRGVASLLAYLAESRIAARIYGAGGIPDEVEYYALGGGELFRGFDQRERQGSAVWVGSLEWRLPLAQWSSEY